MSVRETHPTFTERIEVSEGKRIVAFNIGIGKSGNNNFGIQGEKITSL